MQDYTIERAFSNPDLPPALPHLHWSLKRRLAMSRRQCADDRPHQGRARRQRREIRTRRSLTWRADVLSGAVTFPDAHDEGRTWAELIYSPIDGPAPALRALRARARLLMDRVSTHGPTSGWGIAQPPPTDRTREKWTPYYVPKLCEKSWRWWRAQLFDLRRVLRLIASWWWRLVPPHRNAPRGTPAEEQRSSTSAEESRTRTMYRDHSADWRAAAERVGARITAM